MTPNAYQVGERRPLATRQRPSAKALARYLARAGVSPNAISIAGLCFGVAGGAPLAATPFESGAIRRLLWFAAAGAVQLRLLCNLLDGMVAVECARASALGELYNEVPDRFSDAATLIGA